MFNKVDSARISTVESQIQLLSTAIDTYRLDTGKFPEELDNLVQSDTARWDGPYVPRLPLDPWDQPYQYKAPGDHGPYDLYSKGPEDEGPIGNWNIGQ